MTDAVPARILLIACGALARETLAVIRASRLDNLSVTCLPAILHNRPDRIPERLRQRIRTARTQGFDRIFVLYADCGTGGGIDRVCGDEGVERIAGPHCYSFYAGDADFEALMEEEIGTFFLTDYLVRHFDRLIVEGMGLDRHPDMRNMLFGHYRRLVYLAQTDDPDLLVKAEAAAARLDLDFEHRRTGYGELAGFVQKAAAGTPPSPLVGEGEPTL
ncbi:MAG TPA: DUF1638 domain-containing protein [Alphaproteobacteria bacterium]|nr:DUF1638 domain-containing protein [Alphaproteobacteria bacterium]